MDENLTVKPVSSGTYAPDASGAPPLTAPDDTLEACYRQIAALKAKLDERNARWSALYKTAILFAQRTYSGDVLTQIVQHSMDLLQVQYGTLLEVETGAEAAGPASDSIEPVLVVRVALAARGAAPVRVGLRVKAGQGLTGQALQTGEMQVVDAYNQWPGRVDGTRWEHIGAAIAIPLKGEHGIVGVLGVAAESGTRRFSADELELLTVLALAAAVVLDAVARRRLEHELVVRNERRQIARELHDGLQQHLAALLLQVDACQNAVGAAQPAVAANLEAVAVGLQAIMREIRSTVHVLDEPDLAGRSLEGALRNLVERRAAQTGFRVQLELATLPEGLLSTSGAQALLRVVREALINTQKHAHATDVTVKLERLGQRHIQVSVSDNGRGIASGRQSSSDQPGGFGLLSLREQIEALGGRFGYDSPRHQGSRVWAIVPTVEVQGENADFDR